MVTHYDIHNTIYLENLDDGTGVQILIEHDGELFFAKIGETEDGCDPKLILETDGEYY